jgi:hypothetical protein
MVSGTATLALELIRVLYDATDRQAAQWRSLEGLGVAGSPEAVRYALTRGWLMVQDGDSVCLTDSGRALNQLVILPLSSPVVRPGRRVVAPRWKAGDNPTRGLPPRRRPPT